MVLDALVLARVFSEARSQNGWLEDSVSDDELQRAYDLAKWGPTSMNSQPMRLVFLRSNEAKERLKPAMAPSNVSKVMTAPVVALIAYDLNFHDLLPQTFPHNPNAQGYFTGNPAAIEPTAFRNSSLQAAYFMLALRAVGLDVGPMSGFDAAQVNAAFFAETSMSVNFICSIGRGDSAKIFERLPRLDFGSVAKTL